MWHIRADVYVYTCAKNLDQGWKFWMGLKNPHIKYKQLHTKSSVGDVICVNNMTPMISIQLEGLNSINRAGYCITIWWLWLNIILHSLIIKPQEQQPVSNFRCILTHMESSCDILEKIYIGEPELWIGLYNGQINILNNWHFSVFLPLV